MNGNGNKSQRLGEHFLKDLEKIIKEVEDKQGVKLSIAKVTNFITTHSHWPDIIKDTEDFDFKSHTLRWRL